MLKIKGGKVESQPNPRETDTKGSDPIDDNKAQLMKTSVDKTPVQSYNTYFNLIFDTDSTSNIDSNYITNNLIRIIINQLIINNSFRDEDIKQIFQRLFLLSSLLIIELLDIKSENNIQMDGGSLLKDTKGGATKKKIVETPLISFILNFDCLLRLPIPTIESKNNDAVLLSIVKKIFTTEWLDMISIAPPDMFDPLYIDDVVEYCKEFSSSSIQSFFDNLEGINEPEKFKDEQLTNKLQNAKTFDDASDKINKLIKCKFNNLNNDLKILNTDIYYKLFYIFKFNLIGFLNIFKSMFQNIIYKDKAKEAEEVDDKNLYLISLLFLFMIITTKHNFKKIKPNMSYINNDSELCKTKLDEIPININSITQIYENNTFPNLISTIIEWLKKYKIDTNNTDDTNPSYIYIYKLYQIIQEYLQITSINIRNNISELIVLFDYWMKMKLKLIIYYKYQKFLKLSHIFKKINEAFEETFNKQKKLYFFLKLRHKTSEYNPRYDYIMPENTNTLAFKYYQTTYPLIPLTNLEEKPLKDLVSENYCKYKDETLIQSYKDKSDKIDFIDHKGSLIMAIKKNDEFKLFKHKSTQSWDTLIATTHNMRSEQCKNNGELKEYIFSSYDKIMAGSDTNKEVTNQKTCIEFINKIDHDIGNKNICIIANGLSGSGKTSLLYKVTTSRQGGARSSDEPYNDGLLNCLLKRLIDKKLLPYDFKYKELYCGKILHNPTYNLHGDITSDDIIEKIHEIFKQRKTSLTINNAKSSRSHLIISIDIGQTPEGVEQKMTTIHIIDLAGYENKIDYTNIIFLLSLGKNFTDSDALDKLYNEKLLYYMYTQESKDEIDTSRYEYSKEKTAVVKNVRAEARTAAEKKLLENKIIQNYTEFKSIISSIDINSKIKIEETHLINACEKYIARINSVSTSYRITAAEEIPKLILFLIPSISTYTQTYDSVQPSLKTDHIVTQLKWRESGCNLILFRVRRIEQLFKDDDIFKKLQAAKEEIKILEHIRLNKLRTIAYVTHLEGDSIRESLKQLYSGISTQFKNNIYRNDSACSDKHNSIQRLFDIIYSDIPDEAPKNPNYLRTSIMHSISDALDTSEQKNNTTLAYINIVNISDEIKLNNPPIIPFIDLNNIFDMMLQLLEEYDINKKKELIKEILNNIVSIRKIIYESKYYNEYFDIDKIHDLVANILNDVTESITPATTFNKSEIIYKEDKLSDWINDFKKFEEPINKFLKIIKQQNDMTLMGILSYPDKLLYSGEYYKTCSYTDIGKQTSNPQMNTFFDSLHIQSQELTYDNIVKLLQSSEIKDCPKLEFTPEIRGVLPSQTQIDQKRPQSSLRALSTGIVSPAAQQQSSSGYLSLTPSPSGYPSIRPRPPSALQLRDGETPQQRFVRLQAENLRIGVKAQYEAAQPVAPPAAQRRSLSIGRLPMRPAPTTSHRRNESPGSLRMRGGYNKYLKYKQKYINLKKKLSIYMTL
jgi:hypothetical protein